MLKLYYNPGSCSLASHIALEESGLSYETEWIDLKNAKNETPDYLAKNPWGRVPALEVDGTVLTENVAILQYVADRVPERQLLPKPGTFERAKAVEWLALLSSTVHVAFRPLFRPGRLASTPQAITDVQATGVKAINAVFGKLEASVGARPFVLGEQFSLCDAYLLVFVLWSQRPGADGFVGPRPALLALARRIAQRSSVQAALKAEGLALRID